MNEEMVTLGAVAESSVEKSGPAGETFIYIDISSIDRDKKVISEPKALPTSDAPSRAKQVLQSGDVLVSMTRPNLNQVAIVTPEYHGAIGSTGFHVLRSQWAEPKFLFYLVQSNDFIDEMCKCVQGALYPAVRPKDISSFEFFLPSSLAQQRIVAEIEKQLSRLDEAVANLKRVKANLKRYKAAVLKAAVEGKLTEEWRRGTACRAHDPDHMTTTKAGTACRAPTETGAELLERILAERRKGVGKGKYKEPAAPETSGLPELPEGWVWASAVQACDPVVDCHNKTAPYTESGIPLVRTSNIRDGRLLLDGVRYVDQSTYDFWSRRCPPEPADILFTREAPMGEAAIVPSGLKLCMGQRMMLMRPSGAITSPFLLIALISPVIKRLIELTAVGSGVKHMRVGDVELLPIPLPPLTEQHQIVAEVERRLSIVAGAEAQVDANLRRADRLRQSILKQAFSGQLVPQDPNDEPASVLLERIRANEIVGATRRVAQHLLTKGGRGTASPLRKPHRPSESKPAISDIFASLVAVTTAILGRMQPGREYTRAELAVALGLSTGRWNAAIQDLKRIGKVRQVGEKRGARYVLVVIGYPEGGEG